MSAQNYLNNALKIVKSNSPEILTGLGISGVVITAYLTAKATFKAGDDLAEAPKGLPTKEKAKIVWKRYIPPGISGALTIGCIIGASKGNAKRTAAAVTAYSVTEKAFSEYKEKVVEHVGKGKEQKVRDEVAQDKVDKTSKKSQDVVIIGNGHVLCCELHNGRYFRSDMEKLRKAQNDINEKIINNYYVTLDEFYDIVGLEHTPTSGSTGWDSDRLLELQFSTTLCNGEPCIAFDYNYTKPLN